MSSILNLYLYFILYYKFGSWSVFWIRSYKLSNTDPQPCMHHSQQLGMKVFLCRLNAAACVLPTRQLVGPTVPSPPPSPPPTGERGGWFLTCYIPCVCHVCVAATCSFFFLLLISNLSRILLLNFMKINKLNCEALLRRRCSNTVGARASICQL